MKKYAREVGDKKQYVPCEALQAKYTDMVDTFVQVMIDYADNPEILKIKPDIRVDTLTTHNRDRYDISKRTLKNESI